MGESYHFSKVSSSAHPYLMISMEQGYRGYPVRDRSAFWSGSEWSVILGFSPGVVSDGPAHCLPGAGSSGAPGFIPALLP